MTGGDAPVGVERLDALLAELSAARAARSLIRCVAVVAGPEAGGAFGQAAPVVRALAAIEGLVSSPLPAGTDAGSLLDRVATLHLIASARMGRLRTSLPVMPAPARAVRLVLTAACEILHVLDSVAEVGDGAEVTLALVVDGGFVTLAGTSPASCGPVPPAAAVGSLARLARLADACGGAVRRRQDEGDGFKVGVAFADAVLAL